MFIPPGLYDEDDSSYKEPQSSNVRGKSTNSGDFSNGEHYTHTFFNVIKPLITNLTYFPQTALDDDLLTQPKEKKTMKMTLTEM